MRQSHGSSDARGEYQAFHDENAEIGRGLANRGETDPDTRFQRAFNSEGSSEHGEQMTYEKFVKMKTRERQIRQGESLNRSDRRGKPTEQVG